MHFVFCFGLFLLALVGGMWICQVLARGKGVLVFFTTKVRDQHWLCENLLHRRRGFIRPRLGRARWRGAWFRRSLGRGSSPASSLLYPGPPSPSWAAGGGKTGIQATRSPLVRRWAAQSWSVNWGGKRVLLETLKKLALAVQLLASTVCKNSYTKERLK